MNKEFIDCIFGQDAPFAHVTDFTEDPLDIPQDKRFIAWGGKYAKDYQFLEEPSNQYFTISVFEPDVDGRARRLKDNFLRTPVIVLDDVKEKLSLEGVKLLPPPSYIMETSPGSEQWGYILDTPCTDRDKVNNLLDGLVANGLAPDGKDPGMKGVTRYVRLPDGYNTKKSKMVDGKPFKCRLVEWLPFITTTMEELAKPFAIDLNEARHNTSLKNAVSIPDHPIFTHITATRATGPGRFDITCPWVNEHTGQVDNGSCIFTNADGTLGFQCHHGHCQERTAYDVMKKIEETVPGFIDTYKFWQFKHSLSDVITPGVTAPAPPPPVTAVVSAPPMPPISPPTAPTVAPPSPIEDILKQLSTLNPGSPDARRISSEFLKLIDDKPAMDKQHFHTQLCDIMHWTKMEFATIIKDLRSTWYEKEVKDFYEDIIFIIELNKFYDKRSKIFMTPEAFQNTFSHEDSEVRKEALMNSKVQKVDKMDFAPKMPSVFTRDDIVYANTWVAQEERMGTPGDCSLWLDHWDQLGWGEHKKHMLQWMAYTILHPEHKINHILVLGGAEGVGKDFLLTPLLKCMGCNSKVIDGFRLLENFNSYLLGTKYLHINETELGDHKEATRIRNKIKPLAAAPPDTLSVNQKGITEIDITNIVNVTMTTNSQLPFKLDGASRRYYAVWSDLNTRDSQNQVSGNWMNYFKIVWEWMMTGGGVDHCIYYLRNNVDLSDFNPSSPPPVTEFLQSIQDASKSPGQQTIEAFIANGIGVFKNDLITAAEASVTLRAGAMSHTSFMYADANWFTPYRVAGVLRDIPSCVKLRARTDVEMTVYAIRDKEKYESMSISERGVVYKHTSL